MTLRILGGCCLVAVAATLLTRLTIIGWYFRRYFRPAEQAVPPPEPIGTGPRRPTAAPWYKSGALSFFDDRVAGVAGRRHGRGVGRNLGHGRRVRQRPDVGRF